MLVGVCLPAGAVAADDPPPLPFEAEVPAGTYVLDPAHASLIFRVDHLGFSKYTARFTRFDAQLRFDPADLASSRVVATIDASSIETDYPDPATLDFDAMLQNGDWLDAERHPEMTFRSTRVELDGPRTLRIEGDFMLRGVTHPLTLIATYNGGYAGHPFEPQARIGFSAFGSLQRSRFGITSGLPAAGTAFGVADDVEIIIEAEFSGPPLRNAQR